MITLWGAVGIAFGLWFATGWYLNERLQLVHAKLDRLLENFDGLREYLYEIDPQFDDERRLLTELFSDKPGTMFSGMDHMELEKRKREEGYRTLNAHFLDGGFRAPNQ
ncbi:hypothetical protein [Allosphingosinicella vermicomposti]|uniref:hypothetical protein n=1 Tax=Allosphingosinicella vermicomposti TaxID=614671 RepID=UPI00131A50C7|nr:hypothetical protein [Allosphingosinicella vermicomposti]